MSYEKVVTLFDTAEHAESARANLEKAGFSSDDISIVGRKELADNVLALREPGLWHKLLGRDIAEYEARVYGKTVEGGGAVLTLRVSDSQLAKAMAILNQHHIVDVSHTTRTDSLSTRLTSVVKPSTLTEIGTQLGVPEQTVSRGLSLSSACVLGALANRSGDRGAMQQVIDIASRVPPDTIATGVSAGQLTDPASPMLSTARMFLSSLFGGIPTWAVDLIGGETGLRSGAATSMLALGAHSVLNFIGGRVRGEGMTASALSGFLNSEAPAVLKQLPASFRNAFRAHFADIPATAAAAGRPVRSRRSYTPWVATAAILAAAVWLGLRNPDSTATPPLVALPAVGTSGTIAAPDLGRYVPRALVNGASIVVPERGVETRLLAFITSSQSPDKTSWFDFDRLLFDTGAASLQPQSDDQLRAVAAILKAYPNTQAKIGGYTDNVGTPADNLRLSEERAVNVRSQLIGMGVEPYRLEAEGYGEAHPVADNATEAGRAMNRRISLLVTQK
jgi:OOP family OmpA-OmpF porin